MMEDSHTHTLAAYFITIIAVLGSAWLMPPFPLFILSIGPVCILGLLICILFRKLHARHKYAVIAQQNGTVLAEKERAA
ncbi:MAG TPA: hypothetical protein VNG51_25945 [Ktedonobacteraceae bacterium]|nr:hypothetical protein [Ktedonobacteraceae bacterium]